MKSMQFSICDLSRVTGVFLGGSVIRYYSCSKFTSIKSLVSLGTIRGPSDKSSLRTTSVGTGLDFRTGHNPPKQLCLSFKFLPIYDKHYEDELTCIYILGHTVIKSTVMVIIHLGKK